MDISPQDESSIKGISDDQDLAMALAGVLPDDPNAPSSPPANKTDEHSDDSLSILTISPAQSSNPAGTPNATPEASQSDEATQQPVEDATNTDTTAQDLQAATDQLNTLTAEPSGTGEAPTLTEATHAEIAPNTAPESTSSNAPAIPGDAHQSDNSELDSIKNNALQELRPLIDHADVTPDERFETYLALIRSTDDATLIPPAYAAAHDIQDDSNRARALLDVIREIDYISRSEHSQKS